MPATFVVKKSALRHVAHDDKEWIRLLLELWFPQQKARQYDGISEVPNGLLDDRSPR